MSLTNDDLLLHPFFREVTAIWAGARAQGREYLEYAEWGRFFKAARLYGAWKPVLGEDGRPTGELTTGTFIGKLNSGWGINSQWLRCVEAHAEGISAFQFHLREQRRRLPTKEQKRLDAEAKQELERRAALRDQPKGEVRHFVPRSPIPASEDVII